MKPSVRNILLIVILISGCSEYSAGQRSIDAISDSQKKAFIAFEKVTGYLLQQETITEISLPYLKIQRKFSSIPWQGKNLSSVILMESFSRKLFTLVYFTDMNGLFGKYLTGNGWKTESLGTDHYGEREYRVYSRATKGDYVFDWIFTARDNQNDDWGLNIFILDKVSSLTLPGDCSYTDLFRMVMDYHSGLTKNISPGDCFRVQTYDPPVNFETESVTYRQTISFYCQYGASSTVNGYRCYGELLEKFTSWLKKNGYLVSLKEDHSLPGWTKIIYHAGKEGKHLLFVYEAESASSSGYSKIRLIK